MDETIYAKPWLELEKELGIRQRLTGNLDAMLAEWDKIGAVLVSKLTFPGPDESVKMEELEIAPGLRIRTYTPPNYDGNKPVGIFMHSGGWAMGDLAVEDGQCRTSSKDAGIVIVSVGYRLAPQHPYPAGLDDAVAVYHWALKNCSSLNTTANQAVTFGTSAGGGLAISLALRIIDEGLGNTLKGIVSVTPVTCHPDAIPAKLKSKYTSYDEHADHTINTKSGMKGFFDAYAAPPEDPYTSPLLHTRIKELPKTYILAAGLDTLRDDARLFKEALDDAGVPTKYDEFEGYPHFFWALPSKHTVEVRREYDEKLAAGFAFVLA